MNRLKTTLGLLGAAVLLSVVVKYFLPLVLTGYTRWGIWLFLLGSVLLLALFFWLRTES